MFRLFWTVCFSITIVSALAQRIQSGTPPPSTDKTIAGGSLNLAFAGNYQQVGVSPYCGVQLNQYIDLAGTAGVQYQSGRDLSNNKISQVVYGPGAFMRIFPLRFLYIQGQYEFNFIQKTAHIAGISTSANHDANSFLVGGGLATARSKTRPSYFYFSIVWDVANDRYSPYKDQYDRSIPVIRTGVNISLAPQPAKPRNKVANPLPRKRIWYRPWRGRRW
ncbi:MAG: hypothetical protein ACKO5C_08100 [Ferruginibacter sp.]